MAINEKLLATGDRVTLMEMNKVWFPVTTKQGFVYIDESGNPFLCRDHQNDTWTFKWNPVAYAWEPIEKVDKNRIDKFMTARIDDELAKLFEEAQFACMRAAELLKMLSQDGPKELRERKQTG